MTRLEYFYKIPSTCRYFFISIIFEKSPSFLFFLTPCKESYPTVPEFGCIVLFYFAPGVQEPGIFVQEIYSFLGVGSDLIVLILNRENFI